MTEPNEFTHEDILEAREIVKGWLPKSFAKPIDAGDLDPWGLMDKAKAIVLQQRKAEEVQDG